MKDNNYITVLGWMVNRLGLSGNDLLVYAIIYGFSQDKKTGYEGGGKYICNSCGISRRTLSVILAKLFKKKLILKDYFLKENNVKFCRYKTNPDFYPKEDENNDNSGMAKNAIGYGNKFHSGMAENAIGYGKKCHRSMAENANNINNNINLNTATTAGEQPDLSEKPPPQTETAAAAAVLSPEDIKAALLAINRAMLLKTDFYSRASAFLSLNYLDKGYLAWLYEQCELRNPKSSFEGLYYSLFFAENMAEKYKILKQPPPPPSPPPEFKCPVCGAVHDEQDEKCPRCSLPKNASSEQTAIFRALLSLPPDKRDEYLREESVIYTVCRLDFNKLKTMKNDLNKKFGITVNYYEEPSQSYHP